MTIEYSQPNDYHFSLDSIEASHQIAKWVHQNLNTKSLRVMDVCAGCGVLGFEFACLEARSLRIDFIELQAVFHPHWERNRDRVLSYDIQKGRQRNFEAHWLQINYASLISPEFESQYDLILCNPPYFDPTHGKLTTNEVRNHCHFFLDSTAEILWDSLVFCLGPRASAFVLMRSLEDHQMSLIENLQSRLRYSAQVRTFQMIRGTHLIHILKN